MEDDLITTKEVGDYRIRETGPALRDVRLQ